MATLYMEAQKKPTSLYKDRRYEGDEAERQNILKRSTTLYVGNLSFYTSEEQIFEVFSKAGEIKKIVMGLDRIKRTPCGFCFVEYFTRCDAEASVLHLSGLKLDERLIRVDYDVGFSPNRQFGRGRSGGQVRDEYRTDYDPGRGGFGQSNRMTGMEMWGGFDGAGGPPRGPAGRDGQAYRQPRGGRGGFGYPHNGRGGPPQHRRGMGYGGGGGGGGAYNRGGQGGFRGDRRSSYPPAGVSPHSGQKRRRDSMDDRPPRRNERSLGGPGYPGDGGFNRANEQWGNYEGYPGGGSGARGGYGRGGMRGGHGGVGMRGGYGGGWDIRGPRGPENFVVDRSRDDSMGGGGNHESYGEERAAKQPRMEYRDPVQNGGRFNRGSREEED